MNGNRLSLAICALLLAAALAPRGAAQEAERTFRDAPLGEVLDELAPRLGIEFEADTATRTRELVTFVLRPVRPGDILRDLERTLEARRIAIVAEDPTRLRLIRFEPAPMPEPHRTPEGRMRVTIHEGRAELIGPRDRRALAGGDTAELGPGGRLAAGHAPSQGAPSWDPTHPLRPRGAPAGGSIPLPPIDLRLLGLTLDQHTPIIEYRMAESRRTVWVDGRVAEAALAEIAPRRVLVREGEREIALTLSLKLRWDLPLTDLEEGLPTEESEPR